MLQGLDDLGLLEALLPFCLAHPRQVNYLHDAHQAVADALDEVGFSEAALAK